jgi:hypothetical protein
MSSYDAPTICGSPDEVSGSLTIRAGQFLRQAFAGKHSDKRIAQRLDVSRSMAQFLANGERWTVNRLGFVASLYGRPFIDFVFADALDAQPVEQHWWATHEGRLVPAPAGHAEYARRYFDMPPDMDDDWVACLMRNFGWFAVTLAFAPAGARATVRYSSRMMDPAAAVPVRDWLSRNAGALQAVRRSAEVNRQWIEADHSTVESAIAAIEGAAEFPAAPTHECKVERLSIDDAPHGEISDLLKARAEAPGTSLREFAARRGLMEKCCIFTVRKSGPATTLWIGPNLDIDGARLMGRPVMEWPDLPYAAAIDELTKQTASEGGATLHELDFTISGRRRRYIRGAAAERIDADTIHVVTTPHVLEAA